MRDAQISCAHTQAVLGLCCLHISKDTFLYGAAYMKVVCIIHIQGGGIGVRPELRSHFASRISHAQLVNTRGFCLPYDFYTFSAISIQLICTPILYIIG